MEEVYKKLREPLSIEDIDFRVQSINNGNYVTILAYKDARVDMNRLDEVVGAENWQRHHYEHKCTVGIFNEKINQWVEKEDVGTESIADKEKGLASDSFKRACFNWGIGRELYDYPIIQFRLNPDEFFEVNGKKKPSFEFKLKEWKWLSQFTDDKITFLGAQDNHGKTRFTWGTFDKNRK